MRKLIFTLLLLISVSCQNNEDITVLDTDKDSNLQSDLELMMTDLNDKIIESNILSAKEGKGVSNFYDEFGYPKPSFGTSINEEANVLLIPMLDEEGYLVSWLTSKKEDDNFEYLAYKANKDVSSNIKISELSDLVYEISENKEIIYEESEKGQKSLTGKLFLTCITEGYYVCVSTPALEIIDCGYTETNRYCYLEYEDDPSSGPSDEFLDSGDSSIGGGVGSIDPFAELRDPCKQMEKLEDDDEMIGMLKELQTKTTDDKEYLRFFVKENGSYSYSELVEGASGAAGVNVTISTKVDGYMHSHYSGLLSIFSPADIKDMYNMYDEGKMKNWRKFMSILVTGSGTTYVLKIKDLAKFKAYGQRWFLNNVDFLANEAFYNVTINTNNSNYNNELGFLHYYLKGSGLILFKGNPISFDNWTGVTTNEAGNGIIGDCN